MSIQNVNRNVLYTRGWETQLGGRKRKLITNNSNEFEMVADAMEDGHSICNTTFILNE